MHAICSINQYVYYESRLEVLSMLRLEHELDLAALVTQPFCILGPDGLRRYPDFIYRLTNGRTCVVDVRPEHRVEDARRAFAFTQKVCENIGWEYRILTEMDEVADANLWTTSWFREPDYAPSADRLLDIRNLLRKPMPLGLAARELDPDNTGLAQDHILHLMWTRKVRLTHRELVDQHAFVQWNAS